MNINQLKNSIIFVTQYNTAIYVPSPSYSIGLYSHQGPEINIKKWFMKCLHGDPQSIKMLFEEPKITSEWWKYITEHKNQFLSKNFVKQNLTLFKKLYNSISYASQFDSLNLKKDPAVARFFIDYDMCNQALAAGTYLPNKFDEETLYLLDNKQILDLMKNHIVVLEDKIDLSTLQNNPQQDTLNHVCTHVIIEFWKWQGWI
jgi:hypothetical protein